MAAVELEPLIAKIVLQVQEAYNALDNLGQRFQKFGANGKKYAAEAMNAFNNVTAPARFASAITKATAALEKQKEKVAAIKAEMDKMLSDFGNTPNNVAQVNRAFGPQLAEAEEALKSYEVELRNAQDAEAGYKVSVQEAIVATAEQKAASMEAAQSHKDTTLASYALSMGLRNLNSISGGLVGSLSDIASQVVYLKQVMKASQAGATGFTTALTGIVGAVTIAATVIMKLVEAHNAEVEARRKAAQAAAEYVQSAQQEARAAEVALDALKDTQSSTEDMTAAKNELARLFPSLVTGWTDEGDAILANNAAIKAQLGLLKEEIRLNRELASLDMDAVLADFEKVQKSVDEWAETDWQHLQDIGLSEKEIAELRVKENKAKQDAMNLEADLKDRIKNRIQTEIEGYDKMTSAQQLVIDNHIAEQLALGDLKEIGKGTYRDIAASAEDAANDTKKVEQAEQELSAKMKNSTRDVYDAQKAFRDSLDASASGLNALSSAYSTLSKGEKLSMDNLIKLMDLYPEIGKYIAETGDLTLQNGEYLKTVAEIGVEAAKRDIDSRIKVLEAAKTAKETQIGIIDDLIAKYGGLAGAAGQAYMWERAALSGGVGDIDKDINDLNALLEGFANFSFSGAGGGGGGGKSKSAYEKAMDDFKYQKEINDWTARETLEHLEKINAMYSKSADEQRAMELELHAAKKAARDEEWADEENTIRHSEAMGEDVTARWEDFYRRRAEAADLSVKEQWAAEEWLHDHETQGLLDAIERDASYKKNLGQAYLEEYITSLQTLLQNDQLSAEQRMEVEEKLYAARSEYTKKAMADDEYRLWEMHLGEEELLKARIEMINYWLQYYELAEDEIRRLLKERYDLEMQLIETQKKQLEAELDALKDSTIAMLNGQKAAWKSWADSIKKTISEYLKALDEMTKEEDRADKLADKNREIKEVQLKLAYENDLTNIRNLKNELSKLETERDKMLKGWALEDTKAALKELSEQAGELSASQQAALDAEIGRVKNITLEQYQRMLRIQEKYKEHGLEYEISLTNVAADSASTLIKQFSDSINASLGALAGAYPGVGAKLEQSIEDGLTSTLNSVQSLFEYFRSLQGKLTGQAANIATQAADNYDANRQTTNNVTHNVTINFNQSVQSPYEVARAVEEVGYKLLDGYYN